MAVDTSRIMIKTFVKSALKDAENSPERCTRNLVDMALNFSNNSSQYSFFSIARQMLNNENSPYYPLIEDILKHIDKDKLLNFGLNIGYNSCTKGAGIIRHKDSEEGFEIPWILGLETGDPSRESFLTDYQKIFDQGKVLGIYAYQLHITENPTPVLELAARNSDCAVILFCRAELITEEFAEEASRLNNILIGVEYGDMADTAALILRDHKLLYSLYYICSEENVTDVTSGAFFRFAEEMHSPFAAIIPQRGCSTQTRKNIYKLVLDSRNQQVYRTIPIDLSKDTEHIGNIISPPACIIGFDKDGLLHTVSQNYTEEEANIFHHSFPEILRRYFSKK